MGFMDLQIGYPRFEPAAGRPGCEGAGGGTVEMTWADQGTNY